MARFWQETWTVSDIEVPIRIHYEWRRTTRISIGRRKVIIRLPNFLTKSSFNKHKSQYIDWIGLQFIRHPDLKKRFLPKPYETGQIIQTPRREYRLSLKLSPRKTVKSQLIDSIIEITMNSSLKALQASDTIQSAISRTIAKDQNYDITDRINTLNTKHFNKTVNAVRLKNNVSNWGSCSSNGNINISTRTLLTPLEVQDYIFIHELAHLEILNHSIEYWNLVERVCPDFRKHEEWLKVYGRAISF